MRLPGPADAPLKNVATLQRLADLANVLLLAPEREADVRAITFRPGILASKFRISSASPSLKYSFSLSALMLAKGRTAIEGPCGGVAVTCSTPRELRPSYWNRLAGDLRRQRVTIADRFERCIERCGLLVKNGGHDVDRRVARERLAATQHFIQHQTERENVGTRVRRLCLWPVRATCKQRCPMTCPPGSDPWVCVTASGASGAIAAPVSPRPIFASPKSSNFTPDAVTRMLRVSDRDA